MKKLILLAAIALSGCGTMFENRLSCTVDGSQALFTSKYGPVGITAKVEESDAKVICKKPQGV